MEHFDKFQLILVKFNIISAPVQDDVNKVRRRKVLIVWIFLWVAFIRLILSISAIFFDQQTGYFIKLVLGEYFDIFGQMGHLVNAINVVLHIGYILDRWVFYQQEECQKLYVLKTFSGYERQNVLLTLERQDREKMQAIIKAITKYVPMTYWICLWSCCLPLNYYCWGYSNYLRRDIVYFMTSSVAVVIFTFGLLHGFVTIWMMQVVIAISEEFAILQACLMQRQILNILKRNLSKKNWRTLDLEIDAMTKSYFSMATEIRQQNLTVSKLLRNSVICLCPAIGICILFQTVTGNMVIKFLGTIGSIQFATAMTIALLRVGRVYSNVLAIYPLLCSLQVKLSEEIPINTRLKVQRLIKEIGSSKIPSFTLGDGNAFTKTTAVQFVVATISFCLLALTNFME